jgi:sugar O-acyltransferase (sialic acid O-acetyltransferase NeuD family)
MNQVSSPGRAVAVLGAGGHARVVISTLRAAGYRIAGVYDDDPARWGTQALGVMVLGPLAEATGTAVIAIGHNPTRRDIAARLQALTWVSVVHPAAWVDPTVHLGAGTVIFAGAMIQPETVIGEHVIVNTGATVDHGCVLGDHAHVAPGCHLAGHVTLGTGAFLGIGSVAIPNVRIGTWATIGAGGVVIADVPDGAVAVGVPTRIIRQEASTP